MTRRNRLLDLVVRAVGWNFGAGVVLLAAQMGYTALTARAIPPADFGAYALALTIVQLGSYFGGGTLGNAVMRAPRLGRHTVATSLWLALGLGAGLSVVFAALAAPFSALFRMPALADILYPLSLMPVLTGASAVSVGLLRRQDRYRAAVSITLCASLSAFAVGGVLAASGVGVVALAVAQLVRPGLVLVASIPATRGDISSVRFSRSAAREVLPFTIQVSGQNLVHYVIEAMPVWFVGRATSGAATGYFSRGLQLVQLPAYQLITAMHNALYPVYHRLVGDARRLRRALTDVLVTVDGAASLLFGVAAACGPPAALILLGPGWEEAAALVPWFCAAFTARMVYAVTSNAAEAMTWMRVIWRAQVVFVVVTAAGLLLAVREGLRFAVLAMVVAAAAAHVAMLLSAELRSRIDLRVVVRAYAVHAGVGAVFYVLPAAVSTATVTAAPLEDLALRVAVTLGLIAALLPARRHIPAYEVVTRRWAAGSGAQGNAVTQPVAGEVGLAAEAAR